jgi:tRNA pseudouridine55 synthase
MDGYRSNGIIVIDKPTKMSSARVAAKVKGLLGAKKIGHTGTLDPFASGVLVCCLNQATKLARFLLRGNKRYEAVLKLGASTDTQDVTGKIVGQPVEVTASEKEIRKAFGRFKGVIDQKPPIYSALKHKGKPLYELARNGRPVQKPPRRIEILALDIARIELPYVAFSVLCSAGTYIRTLCQDIGVVLGCGGYLHALRRSECSGFTIAQAVTLPDLEKEVRAATAHHRIVPMAACLPEMAERAVSAATAAKIRQGQPLRENDLIPLSGGQRSGAFSGYIKILDDQRELVSVVKRSGDGHQLEYCCVFPN